MSFHCSVSFWSRRRMKLSEKTSQHLLSSESTTTLRYYRLLSSQLDERQRSLVAQLLGDNTEVRRRQTLSGNDLHLIDSEIFLLAITNFSLAHVSSLSVFHLFRNLHGFPNCSSSSPALPVYLKFPKRVREGTSTCPAIPDAWLWRWRLPASSGSG